MSYRTYIYVCVYLYFKEHNYLYNETTARNNFPYYDKNPSHDDIYFSDIIEKLNKKKK